MRNHILKTAIIISFLIFFLYTISAQLYDYRNKDLGLVSYSVDNNILYGSGKIEYGNETLDLFLDAYIPQGIHEKKAAILVMHAGGFVEGDKLNGGVVRFSEYFAKRGFVCFSINYRLGPMKPPVYHDTGGTFARKAAIIDGKKALRWIHANVEKYNIDPSNIFLYGASAGGVMSLYIATSDYSFYLTDSDGEIVESDNNPGVSMDVQAAMAMSGSLYEDTFLINSGDPALMIFHGTEDTVVPFKDIPSIYYLAIKYNVPIDYYALDGEGHMPSMATVDGKTFNELAFEFILKNLNTPLQISESIKIQDKIRVCPNPIDRNLNIGLLIQSKISLFSISGEIIDSWELPKGTNNLSLKNVKTGMYLLEIICKSGEREIIKLLVN